MVSQCGEKINTTVTKPQLSVMCYNRSIGCSLSALVGVRDIYDLFNDTFEGDGQHMF